MTSSTDPFSASIIPFEVPEQMRAFAEKGVSQARDSYAKFKDVAESHNSAIEAVFTTASKGASQYSAKLMEMMKSNTTASLDFAQELLGAKSPSEAMELWSSHARPMRRSCSSRPPDRSFSSQKSPGGQPGLFVFSSRSMRADGVMGVSGGLAKEGRCT